MTSELHGRQVHPAAALFPMLADDELADLAADIKERGLLQPVVLDKDGRILDGRNRYAACSIAGVEPKFETYEGDDPYGYALASGSLRRNLTQGQRAMVIAKSHKLWNSKRGSQAITVRMYGVPNQRISEATLILEQAPDLAEGVLAGEPLSRALEKARERKAEQQAREAKMTRLREDANDLLVRVVDEGMDLDEAIAALDSRLEKALRQAQAEQAQEKRDAEEFRRKRREATLLLCRLVTPLAKLSPEEVSLYDPKQAPEDAELTEDIIKDAFAVLDALTETLG